MQRQAELNYNLEFLLYKEHTKRETFLITFMLH